MYRFLRPALFRLDAERAHGLGMGAVALGSLAPGVVRALYRGADDPRLAQTLWGLQFRAPLGLAAGFDKNARGIGVWDALGFGFAEVGSVTAQPSDGNPPPRAFRLPDDRALINRMGLNNDGAERIAARLGQTDWPSEFIVAVNVAKTHDPAILGEAGVEDFRASVRLVLPHANLLVLNVSCPNTAEG
ncbi:MAG: quinone-dependent dihydroorotate dehydrogenase, partial [Bacteroidota bacterium]